MKDRLQGAMDVLIESTAAPEALAPDAAPTVTPEMVTAYLTANDAYWQRTDTMPSTNPTRWRNGNPRDATAESLRAALAASAHPVAGGSITRERAIEIAIKHAAQNKENRGYLDLVLCTRDWQPHGWVVDAIMEAAAPPAKAEVGDREKQLVFALQAAWPYVHQWCTIQSVRQEVSLALFGRVLASEGHGRPPAEPVRDPSRTRIDAQDVAEFKAKIAADPSYGVRLLQEAGIYGPAGKLLPKFSGIFGASDSEGGEPA